MLRRYYHSRPLDNEALPALWQQRTGGKLLRRFDISITSVAEVVDPGDADCRVGAVHEFHYHPGFDPASRSTRQYQPVRPVSATCAVSVGMPQRRLILTQGYRGPVTWMWASPTA